MVFTRRTNALNKTKMEMIVQTRNMQASLSMFPFCFCSHRCDVDLPGRHFPERQSLCWNILLLVQYITGSIFAHLFHKQSPNELGWRDADHVAKLTFYTRNI